MRRIFKIDNRNRTNKEVRKFERDGTKWKAHEKYQNESVCCLDHTNLRWTLYWQTKQNKIKLKIQTSPFVTLWTLERINDHGIDFVLIHARIGKDFIRMDGEIHTVNSLRCCCCKWEREFNPKYSILFMLKIRKNCVYYLSVVPPLGFEKKSEGISKIQGNLTHFIWWDGEKNVDWKKLDVKKKRVRNRKPNLNSLEWNETNNKRTLIHAVCLTNIHGFDFFFFFFLLLFSTTKCTRILYDSQNQIQIHDYFMIFGRGTNVVIIFHVKIYFECNGNWYESGQQILNKIQTNKLTMKLGF